MRREFFGRCLVDGFAIDDFGQAGIGFDPDRQRAGVVQSAANFQETRDALATVSAEDINAAIGQFRRRALGASHPSWCGPSPAPES